MEPLSPNDPLWKLLGQARPVKVRPNFSQNLLRAARQTPQDSGVLARLRAWFEEGRPALPRQAVVAGAFALVAAVLVGWQMWPHADAGDRARLAVAATPANKGLVAGNNTIVSGTDAEFPTAPEVGVEWENMEKFDALLAVEDTSELTDREIHLLLY